MAGCEIPVGLHCPSLTGPVGCPGEEEDPDQYYKTTYSCLGCFLPNHCDAGNQCQPGTTGDTCEACLSGYQTVGSECLACTAVPWRAITLTAFILLTVIFGFVHGASPSIYVKYRLLIDYIQGILITSHVRAAWSSTILTVFSALNFIQLNIAALDLECLIDLSSRRFYMEWASSGLLLLLLLLAWFLLIPTFSASKQVPARRILGVLLMCCSFSVMQYSLQTQACSKNIPIKFVLNETADTDLFLYYQSPEMACNTIIFQTVSMLSVLFLLLLVLVGPLVVSLVIYRVYDSGRLQQMSDTYGWVYEAYRRRGCLWEFMINFRRAVGLGFLLIYPFSPITQLATIAVLFGIYLLLLLIVRPYRPCGYKCIPRVNIHLVFDTLSSVTIILLQVPELLRLCGVPSVSVATDVGVVILIGVPLVLWVVLAACVSLEKTYPEIEDSRVEGSSGADCILPDKQVSLTEAASMATESDLKQKQHALRF